MRALVRRAGLDERLRASAAEAAVVVVHGPSGIGKTSLLMTWVAAETQPVAWLSIDVRDNDPGRFWAHVAGALEGAVGERLSGTSPDEAPVGSDLFVDALIDRFIDNDRRSILVLDEYEHITDDQVHQQLDMFIRGCGDRLTTVVAGRVRPRLRLDQLALSGRLAVFTWSDLRMDEDEAGRLFREAFDFHLPADRVASLVRSIDGWAGGLALVGARMRADARTAFDDDLPVGSEVLADHLMDHVWATLPPRLREFLLDTAVLERFCVPLADAVHHDGDAAQLIDRLRLDGVFLLRETQNNSWFRYQRVFRWALARRLSALDPVRERNAHLAAARWNAVHGSREDAVDHALRGGDHEFALDLIEQSFDFHAAAGRLTTLERWLESVPDAAIAAGSPGLADRALDLWCTGRTGPLEPGHRA